jgi:hypothetical protein
LCCGSEFIPEAVLTDSSSHDAQAKKNAEREIRKKLAPAAILKLAEKQGDISKLTKAEIAAILYDKYNDDVCLAKHRKPELMKRLQDKTTNSNQNDPATEFLAAEYPKLEFESGEWDEAASVESIDEGAGYVFEQSYGNC